MKIKYWILATTAALWAAACTSEDVEPPSGETQGEMEFDVAIPSFKRDPTTTLNIQNFNLCAYENGNGYQLFMNNVKVKRTGINSWKYEPLVIWPDFPLNFVAVSPDSIPINVNHWWYNTIEYNAKDGKTDVVIAVRMDVKQTNNRLKLNFAHILSRVQVDVRTTVEENRVELKEIMLYNMNLGGTFYFPFFNTLPGHPPIDNCWANWVDAQARGMFPYYVADNGDAYELTSERADLDNQGNIFLVPFKFPPMQESNGYISGTAIRLTCRFISKATGEKVWPNADTPYQLLPNNTNREWGYIFFPLQDSSRSQSWLPGIDYHYHLTVAQEGLLPVNDSTATRSTSGNTFTVTAQPY